MLDNIQDHFQKQFLLLSSRHLNFISVKHIKGESALSAIEHHAPNDKLNNDLSKTNSFSYFS